MTSSTIHFRAGSQTIIINGFFAHPQARLGTSETKIPAALRVDFHCYLILTCVRRSEILRA